MKYFSKRWTFLLCLLPIIGNAQTVTTYHSRFGIAPIASSYLAVDIAVIDEIKNPDYKPLYRSWQAPALIDTEYKIGVTITGTITQAETQLAAIKANQYPASVKFTSVDRRTVAMDAADKAANANSVPALRAEVKRLAELIQSLLEDGVKQ